MSALDVDWGLLLTYAVKFVVAFVLALPIALEREGSTRTMGLRTFPLVAVASCGFVLVALAVVGTAEDAQSRVIAGLMTGMGFIGGGAILKKGPGVRGTATAASLWTTGAVGASVGYGLYELAVLIGLVTFLTLTFLTPIEQDTGKDDRPNEDDSPEDETDGSEDED